MTSIQHKIWLERAGLTVPNIILTEDQIEKIIKKLHDEDGSDFGKINEEIDEDEETKKKSKSDTKGKLHEILTGYHLNGGKHMTKHPDQNGDSPEEAHEKLKSKVTSDEYKKINARAKSAAADIKKKIETNGHKIHQVHWTSQPNDIQATTGIKATQKEDASDIVISTKKKYSDGKSTTIHHGISLKVTDGASKHVPVSNLGIKFAGPHAQSIHDDHKRHILRKFPKLGLEDTNAEQRKARMKSDPKMNKYVRQKNTETLHKIAEGLHHHLNSMSKENLMHHIKTVIHSHATPMQMKGHMHMRHVTTTSRGEFKHHSIDPSYHHEHIFKDPHNISVEHHGAAIHFKHNGKTFARQAIKFSSQSDPLSSIKGSGQTAGD
jgi:hypothetical protein